MPMIDLVEKKSRILQQFQKLPALASYLVQEIAAIIEKRGYVPFYTTWAANLASTRIALRCGFIPFMVEYFAEEC